MGFEPVTSQFNIGYTVKPPRATTFCRRPPSQNNKNLVSQCILLEPLVNDHLP